MRWEVGKATGQRKSSSSSQRPCTCLPCPAHPPPAQPAACQTSPPIIKSQAQHSARSPFSLPRNSPFPPSAPSRLSRALCVRAEAGIAKQSNKNWRQVVPCLVSHTSYLCLAPTSNCPRFPFRPARPAAHLLLPSPVLTSHQTQSRRARAQPGVSATHKGTSLPLRFATPDPV